MEADLTNAVPRFMDFVRDFDPKESHLDTAILFSFRYNSVLDKEMSGLADMNAIELEKRQIVVGILGVIRKIQKQPVATIAA